MGKNKRRQLQHHDDFHDVDVMCDSQEECDFINWCSEAASLGFITDYEYQPKPFLLFDSTTYINIDNKKRVLLRSHEYSPDFMVRFNPQLSRMLSNAFKLSSQQFSLDSIDVFLDVKGTFMRNDGGRAFSINQKWVYQKYDIFVQKIVPVDFFKICGCPLKSFISRKTRRARKMFKGYPSIQQQLQKEPN